MPAGTDRHQYKFSGFRLDPVSRVLFGPDGAALPLTSKALDVLVYLVERSPRMVAKDELLTAVWPRRIVEQNNLAQAISALRKAFCLGAADEHCFIVTVPGRGYRFVAPTSAAPFPEQRQPADGVASPGAADRLYLAGRDLVAAPNLSRCERAIDMFRQALEINPRHARAWSGQAIAWRELTMTADMDPKQAFPLAKAAVQHALALDPDLPEAHAARGCNLCWADWDWRGAELAFRHAISLDQRAADGHSGYAQLLNNMGRFDEALAHARTARELNPLAPLINTLEGAFLAIAGRTEEAEARIAQALEIAPGFWLGSLVRAGMMMERGAPAAAVAIVEHAAKLSGRSSNVVAVLASTLVATGNRAGAEMLREELRALSQTTYVPGTSRAAISNTLGDHAEALDLLELAFEQRDVRMTFIMFDARWNNLRTRPRFKALMRRMRYAPSAARGAM